MYSLVWAWMRQTLLIIVVANQIGSPSNSTNKNQPPTQLTPLEKLLQDAPPLKDDGRDRFFGLENVSIQDTLLVSQELTRDISSEVHGKPWVYLVHLLLSCLQAHQNSYGSSILQCLFYSIPFRDQVINFPVRSVPEVVQRGPDGQTRLVSTVPFPQTPEQLAKAKAQPPHHINSTIARSSLLKPEDKESQEYKKKQVLSKGPLWALRYDNASNYGMKESLFTCMKDLFEAMSMNEERMGIIAPYKFYEIMRSSIHETWGGSQHQDAHEFLNLLLNSVVDTVDEAANPEDTSKSAVKTNGTLSITDKPISKPVPASSRWVHEIFEGTLTSETKCLTCENISQRDESFLDLSVDLDAHSSVTACLKRFSQEEMLREKDKFFCDICGGLQEAEKRMKIKRLPKILALHLKRFRYTEDMQRMNKLFHRITYPEQLRLFNTTSDAEDPDMIYELYAVVVHIGAGPYHGHYVSVIKTRERGWLLFDDELVEPVDKSFVMNFFGDRSSLACAYVLFYQETTAEAVKAEQEAEGRAAVAKLMKDASPVKESHGFGLGLSLKTNGFMSHQSAAPTSPTEELANPLPILDHTKSAPQLSSSTNTNGAPLVYTHTIATPPSPSNQTNSRKDRQKEEKERKIQEKEAAKAEKAAAKEAKALKKDEEMKQKQAVRWNGAETKAVVDSSKQVEPVSSSRNIFSTLNNQTTPTSTPGTHTPGQMTGKTLTPSENSTEEISSFKNTVPTTLQNGPILGRPTTSQTIVPATNSSVPIVASPLTSTPIQASPSSVGSAFSRFRQTSRSIKHRPKFWPGSSSAASTDPPLPTTRTSNENIMPSTSTMNGHAIGPSVNGIVPPIKPQDHTSANPENGSVTQPSSIADPGGPSHTTQRPPTTADDHGDKEALVDGEKSTKKRSSRFSLRKKGSNILNFGGDK